VKANGPEKYIYIYMDYFHRRPASRRRRRKGNPVPEGISGHPVPGGLKYIALCWRYLYLQTTPLNCLQSFIADSTSLYYNHSLQSILTPRCLVSGRSVDVLWPRALAAN
jgi:hypothetical protein